MKNIKVSNRIFTDQLRREVVEFYKIGNSLSKCSQRFNVDRSTVSDWLRSFSVSARSGKISRRIYNCNEQAFDTSSAEQAYWLGFLFADGNVGDSPKRSLILTVALQERDKEHLEKLKNFLNTDYPLIYRRQTKSFSLTIASDYLCESLIKRGCVPRKSLTLQYPSVGLFYRKHFIRGYFDGDGSIYVNEKVYRQTTVSFVGTTPFLQGLQEVLCSDTELNLNKIYDHKHSAVKYLSWTGRNNVRKIHDYIYQEGGVMLERKKKKFEYALAY